MARYTELVTAYLNGDTDAIDIIDSCVDVGQTVNAIREGVFDPEWEDDMRNDADQVLDALTEPFTRAQNNGWVGPPAPLFETVDIATTSG